MTMKSYVKKTLKSAGTVVRLVHFLSGVISDAWDSVFRPKQPRTILKHLDLPQLNFFRRRIPQGEQYEYEVHFAPTLKNVPSKLSRFFLVGKAWKKTPEAPVALAFGFNDWKYGFITDYCPDERLAFAPRQYLGMGAKLAVSNMKPAPAKIYIWGYTDLPWLEKFAKMKNIPLVRVEDGFLRSADLGASHATPYSLVFDKQGLFYNTSEPNDLATILEETDFSQRPELIEQAQEAKDTLLAHHLSKYNLPEFESSNASIPVKTRHRVLVIGQVDNDAAIRMGNPDGWSMLDMVRLAKLENPKSEILYRPHPDVYRGYQKSRFRGWMIDKFARILPPEGSLPRLLDTVDHLYTISSLTGLEALIRGKKVTTLGTPFYAGYGLTDDRATKPIRELSALELFAAVYLLYPRYLATPDASFSGFGVAAMRIQADRKLLSYRTSQSAAMVLAGSNQNGRHKLFDVLDSKALFSREYAIVRANLAKMKTAYAQSIVCFCVLGRILDENERVRFLMLINDVLILEALNTVLLILVKLSNEPSVYHPVIYKLLRRGEPTIDASRLIDWHKSSAPTEKAMDVPEQDVEAANSNEADEGQNLRRIVAKMEAEFAAGHRNSSIATAASGLIQFPEGDVFLKHLLSVAVDKFDFQGAKELSEFALISGNEGLFPKVISVLFACAPDLKSDEIVDFANFYMAAMPEKVVNANLLLGRLPEHEAEQLAKEQLALSANLTSTISVKRVQVLLAHERNEEALELAHTLVEQNPDSPQALVVYSQALTANDQIDVANEMMKGLYYNKPTELVIREVLRVCILADDYEYGLSVLSNAKSARIDVGDMLPRKILFGARQPGAALQTFDRLRVRHEFMRCYPQHYCLHPENGSAQRSIFAAAIFGPGDEIRWAAIYRDLSTLLPHGTITIGCDPRLQKIFERSFPNLTFLPVKRVRNSDGYAVEDYNRVHSSSFVSVLDNVGHDAIMEADDFVLVSDLLKLKFKDYDSFEGASYLVADKKQVAKFKRRLPKNIPLVGISWRSSVMSHGRNEHYVSVEELAPLFEIEGVQFVNLQYGDCASEVEWVEANFPGRLIDLTDIDQFDDLDGVAALMESLDLVISTMVTPVELAGAIGKETWLITNSTELSWRKKIDDLKDVWHSSIEHFSAKENGGKAAVVDMMKNKLLKKYPNEV